MNRRALVSFPQSPVDDEREQRRKCLNAIGIFFC